MVAQTNAPPSQEERDARLLSILAEHPGMRMGEIVERMPVGRSAVASQIARLIKEGRVGTNKHAVSQPGDTRYWKEEQNA